MKEQKTQKRVSMPTLKRKRKKMKLKDFKLNKVLVTDAFRTIEKSQSRFLSIILIVALGVSFFAGMNAIAPNMYDTMDSYIKSSNAMDIQIISTVGFTETDLSVIASINGIESAVGEKFVDGIVKVNGETVSDIDGSEMTVRAISLDMNKVYAHSGGTQDSTYMNRPELVEGTWPTSSNQCLVDQSTLSTPEQFKIGSVITVTGDGTDISSSLSNTEYTIVGIIRTPLYISYERGNTTVGTGKLGTFVYLPSENFLADYYSSVSIKLLGSENYDPYSEKYEAFVAPYISYLNSISNEMLSPRVTSLKSEYASLVAEGEAEYAQTKIEIETSLANAQKQVEDVLYMAENGDKILEDYKIQYNNAAQEINATLDASKLEHSTQYALWEEKLEKYNETKDKIAQYSDVETTLANAKTEYNVANLQVNTMLTTVSYLEDLIATTRSALDQFNTTQDATVGDIINRFETSGLVGEEVNQIMSSINALTATGTAEEMVAYLEPQLQTFEARLASSKAELSAAQTTLAEKKAQLDKAEELVETLNQIEAQLAVAAVELEEAEAALTAAGYDIQLGELEALTELSDLKNQITAYETNLTIAKTKAPTIEAEYEAAKVQANEKLEQARKQLDAAKDFLLDLDNAKWYVNNRNDGLLGFEEYGQSAARTRAISLVFPWFFFFVAALVCLNTMTRMIEEDRTRIGTFKALGLTDYEIMAKYLIFSLAASAIGSIAGSFLGFALFPSLVDSAYSILFDTPTMIIRYRFSYAIPAILISILTTVGATYYSCFASLTVVPATLMRSKAPKSGKHIFLEKIPFIWTKLNFVWKVTFRNVFRNFRRFIMATFGVLGCTALLVAAFGLNDSINNIIDRQFKGEDRIWSYDMQIVLGGSYDTTIDSCDAYETVQNNPYISTAMLEYMKVFDATSDDSDKSMEIYLLVPENETVINNYISLVDAKKGTPLTPDSSGAIITKKLADNLNISPGENITVITDEGHEVSVPVTAIAENYAFHYVYMTKDLYKAVFGTNPLYNYITANLAVKDLTLEQKASLAESLVDEYGISAVAYIDEILDSFQNIMDTISYIVVILIVCAGLLCFIVLYNLSVINITERLKEIATIKVLGFDDGEVSAYIFRENIVLTIIGVAEGLLWGKLLHAVVLYLAEVDIITFSRDISAFSFIISAVLSFAFSMFVNVVLHKKLKSVDMVESLKSIE